MSTIAIEHVYRILHIVGERKQMLTYIKEEKRRVENNNGKNIVIIEL